ncbi:TPA: hypothetical protein N0F65_008422 [Lagenidium giganteum]|uniref:TIR domain-containing protein n=1 Tax=Lagenidium giganteum TaxID=4803 RepID=A0AAV2Z165_9STRA|nr:TPA: hypothetical protein N0F65_008422 [Lagenidium giganteum]
MRPLAMSPTRTHRSYADDKREPGTRAYRILHGFSPYDDPSVMSSRDLLATQHPHLSSTPITNTLRNRGASFATSNFATANTALAVGTVDQGFFGPHTPNHAGNGACATPHVPNKYLNGKFKLNSYFAIRLLRVMELILLLDLVGIGMFYFYQRDVDGGEVEKFYVASPFSALYERGTACEKVSSLAALIYHLFPAVIILGLPASGIRAFEPFKREQRVDRVGRLQKVKRTICLQVCEVTAVIMFIYTGLISVTTVYFAVGGKLFGCHRLDIYWFFLGGCLVYFLLFVEIRYFTRFREHLKMQLGAFKEADQTGDVRAHVIRSKMRRRKQQLARTNSASESPPRSVLVANIRKRLFRGAQLGDLRLIRKSLRFARTSLGENFAAEMYPDASMFLCFGYSKKNPMHIAAYHGNIEALELFHRANFNLNAFDKVARVRFSTGDLFWAFASYFIGKPVESAEDAHGAGASIFRTTLVTPLHCAVSTGRVEAVRWLLAHGADANLCSRSSSRSEGRLPPIFLADHPDVVRELLAAGANHLVIPDPGHVNTITVLQLAYLRGNYAVAEVLEDWGGDIALTPLHTAAAMNDTGTIQHFMKKKVNPNCMGELGYVGLNKRTPLHWAAINGAKDAVEALLAANANANFQDAQGRTALHWAARVNRFDIVRLLLEKGADPNIVDLKDMTPVLCAACAGGTTSEMFKALVTHGANINHQMKPSGDTALHLAVKLSDIQTALALLSVGGDIMRANSDGFRPIDCTNSTRLQFELKRAAGNRDVMISYTHTHTEFALKLRKSLEDANITTWLDLMDPSGIGGGSVWREEIVRGITNAAVVMCILTEDYASSQWCMKELAIAKQVGTPIMAISTEKLQISEELQVYLYTRQIIPFENAIASINKENPKQITYAYNEQAYQKQLLLLLDGLRDQIEKRKEDGIRKNMHRRVRSASNSVNAGPGGADSFRPGSLGSSRLPKSGGEAVTEDMYALMDSTDYASTFVEEEKATNRFRRVVPRSQVLVGTTGSHLSDMRGLNYENNATALSVISSASSMNDEVNFVLGANNISHSILLGQGGYYYHQTSELSSSMEEDEAFGSVLATLKEVNATKARGGQFVYICHGDFHAHFVKRLCASLCHEGFQCYVDRRRTGASNVTTSTSENGKDDNISNPARVDSVTPDDDLALRIHEAKEAILKCSAFVVIISEKTLGAEMVKDQLAFAEDKGKKILPVVLNPLLIPDEVKYSLSRSLFYSFFSKADMMGFDKSLDHLLNGLREEVYGITVDNALSDAMPERKASAASQYSVGSGLSAGGYSRDSFMTPAHPHTIQTVGQGLPVSQQGDRLDRERPSTAAAHQRNSRSFVSSYPNPTGPSASPSDVSLVGQRKQCALYGCSEVPPHHYIDSEGRLRMHRQWRWLYNCRSMVRMWCPWIKQDSNTFLCADMIMNTWIMVVVFALRTLLSRGLVAHSLHRNDEDPGDDAGAVCHKYSMDTLDYFGYSLVANIFLCTPALNFRLCRLFSRKSSNEPVELEVAVAPTGLRREEAVPQTRWQKTYLFVLCELVVVIEIPCLLFAPFALLLNTESTNIFHVSRDCHRHLTTGYFVVFIMALAVGLYAYYLRWRQIIIFHRLHEHLLFQRGVFPGCARFEYVERCFMQPHLIFASRQTRRRHRLKAKLYSAAKLGDQDQVRVLIDEAVKLDGDDFAARWYTCKLRLGRFATCQRNPLHVAIVFGRVEVVEELITRGGFDVNALEKMELLRLNVTWFYTALFNMICFLRKSDFSRHGTRQVFGPVGLTKSTLLTPLHVAATMGCMESVLILLRFGADPNIIAHSTTQKFSTPPLFWSINKECSKLLLAADANPLFVPGHGYYLTSYEVARLTGNHAVALAMEKYGADVALTPLHDVASKGLTPEVKFYLKHGADANTLGEKSTGYFNRTPLHWAAIRGNSKVIDILVRYGGNVHARDKYGRTPLAWACLLNRVKAVEMLLKHGSDPNDRDDNGDPILCLCAAAGLDQRCFEDDTIDNFALAKSLDERVLELLISHGVDLHAARESNGDTALHVAMRHRNEKAAILLVRSGISVTAVNFMGQRAIDSTNSTTLRYAVKKEAGHRDVMISYCHSHATLAHKIRDELEKAHVTTWIDSMDPTGITGGAVWRQEIAQGIQSSALVLALLMEDYPQSQWCMKELAFAKTQNVPVVAIQCEDMEITEELQVYLWTRQMNNASAHIVAVASSASSDKGDDSDHEEILEQKALQPMASVEFDDDMSDVLMKCKYSYEYDDEAFRSCMSLLLDGIRDQIEEHRKNLAMRQRRNALQRAKRGPDGHEMSDYEMNRRNFNDTSLEDDSSQSNPTILRTASLTDLTHIPPSNSSYVFISHGDYHHAFCQRIKKVLRKHGIRCVIDEGAPTARREDIHGRLNMPPTIDEEEQHHATTSAQARQLAAKDHIIQCSAMIVVLSPLTLKSALLTDQLAFAENQGTVIVPVMLSLHSIDLAKRYTLSRSMIHHFNVSIGFEQSMESLVTFMVNHSQVEQDSHRRGSDAATHAGRQSRSSSASSGGSAASGVFEVLSPSMLNSSLSPRLASSVSSSSPIAKKQGRKTKQAGGTRLSPAGGHGWRGGSSNMIKVPRAISANDSTQMLLPKDTDSRSVAGFGLHQAPPPIQVRVPPLPSPHQRHHFKRQQSSIN